MNHLDEGLQLLLTRLHTIDQVTATVLTQCACIALHGSSQVTEVSQTNFACVKLTALVKSSCGMLIAEQKSGHPQAFIMQGFHPILRRFALDLDPSLDFTKQVFLLFVVRV